jgi:hypothetical protein
MEELRLHIGARLGINVEHDHLHFTRNVSERHQVPGLLMERINTYASRAFSDLDIRLGLVVPPLGPAQLEVLHSIAGRLESSVPPHQRILIPGLLQGNARTLLAAQESNGGRPLFPSQIWQAALVMSRLLGTNFPGIEFSEHGNFSVTAKQRDDTNVVINIDSDPGLPLRFHQQYIIEPNGDRRCLEFVMERR